MTHDAPAPSGRLGRLRLIGLAAPVAFVAALLFARPHVIGAYGLEVGHTVLGTALLLSAAGFGWAMHRALGSAHAAALEAERLSAALLERDRIARELHDSLAQVVGVTHLRLRALAGRPALASDPRLRGELDDLADLCQQTHRDVREAILGLKDAHRHDRALLDHLEDYTALFSRTSGIPTTLCTEAARSLSLPPDAEVQVIRVIQEALSNVRKHAGARSATVRVQVDAAHTDFVVSDDGQGFSLADTHRKDGFGLTTMRERTESVGGRLCIESTPGRGTDVTVRLPHRSPARHRIEEMSA